MPEEAAEAAIEAAWDAGVRFFDTAPFYGFGLSEHRFGRVLRRKPRAEFALCTKVGRLLDPDEAAPRERGVFVGGLPFRPRFDYSADGASRSVEHRLMRLCIPRLEVVLTHDSA